MMRNFKVKMSYLGSAYHGFQIQDNAVTVQETVEKFQLARQMGMDNINMDLIIGLPNEDVSVYARSLEETAKTDFRSVVSLL